MVKVVSLSNEAYEKLKVLKGDKSFSDLVIELVEEKRKRKKEIMKFAGIFSENSKFWGEMEKKIYEDRKRSRLREIKF
ncbi:MAG: antitoxin VapB family protein [Nanoarchaeota archaeon]|nr:antitoxin VapB family protein [Nanoarchaeota archaeon]